MIPELSPTQQQIVGSTASTLVALGGAGTGKTTAALHAARTELEDRAEPHQRVLFLTFSRTAVGQILDRAGPILAGYENRVEILTFHGFAYRMILDFGRYAGLGTTPLRLVGEAEARMSTGSDQALRFDDLLPGGLCVLASDFVSSLLHERWPLVICDEFQDTGNNHWQLLERLAPPARLLLLADPNQMIYDGFVPGVGSHRIEQALRRDGAEFIELEAASFRDPSQVIPAAAAQIRGRNFNAAEVIAACAQGRLTVRPNMRFEDVGDVVKDVLAHRQSMGDNSFGVFVHGNDPAAKLSAALTQSGVQNVAVGFPEAYGQSLAVMLETLRYAHQQGDWQGVEFRLAVLVTALSRTKDPPRLARMLGGDEPRPAALDQRLRELEAKCAKCVERVDAIRMAADVWSLLGIPRGQQTWQSAAEVFLATASTYEGRAREDWLEHLAGELNQHRMTALVNHDGAERGTVQVMNLHQTKGREADATVLVFRDGEYFGRESEPYERNSRLLYVGLTRARNHVTVVLGRDPHPLVAPFLRHVG